jgi:fibronectin type 3 domain-containing protein
VVGYDIYRSVAGSSVYTALNASLDTTTTYLDKTVQAGVTYDYIIESVDGAGVRSAPSNVIAIAVP